MKGAAKTTKLRCKPGDLARVVASTNPALVGAIVLIERLRSDGRWDVALDRPAFGFTSREKRPVVTCAFTFRDASLEPIPQKELGINLLRGDLHPSAILGDGLARIAQAIH